MIATFSSEGTSARVLNLHRGMEERGVAYSKQVFFMLLYFHFVPDNMLAGPALVQLGLLQCRVSWYLASLLPLSDYLS